MDARVAIKNKLTRAEHKSTTRNSMSFFNAISLWFDKAACTGRKAACSFFDKENPTLTRTGSRALKHEGDQVAVAVFYRTAMPSRPEPYKVFVVNTASGTVSEMDPVMNPEYATRGYK